VNVQLISSPKSMDFEVVVSVTVFGKIVKFAVKSSGVL